MALFPHLETEAAVRLAELGFELVELRRGGTARRPLLALRIDVAGADADRSVTVDECARVSRALEEWLDASGLAGGRYVLEVSSPGLDRPLRRLDEWRRFSRRPVEVLVPALGGRFRVGVVAIVDGPEPAVELEFPKGERRLLRLEDIKEARLAVEW